MFHHANLDRSRLWWMLRNNQQEGVCNYYSFPTENAPLISSRGATPGGNNFVGAHLKDVLSSSWGFTVNDLGLKGASDSDPTVTLGLATHADIICRLNPESVPYTYDTHVDCLTDSTLCNAVQKIAAAAIPDDDTISVGNSVGEDDALASSTGTSSSSTLPFGFMAALLVAANSLMLMSNYNSVW